MMSSIEVWSTDGLKKLEYPPEALWETIVNAVIHRDYSISDDIQILVFDNRIEILSPGKLPGYVSIDNILNARFSRNSKLVRTLNRYRDAPNKDLGEGLNTAFQKMKEFGLKDPIITEEGNYLKVVLPHLPLAVPTVAIMDFLRQHDQISNRQARDLTGIRSENSVKTEFYKLRDEGHIERVPDLAGNKSAWRRRHDAVSRSGNGSDQLPSVLSDFDAICRLADRHRQRRDTRSIRSRAPFAGIKPALAGVLINQSKESGWDVGITHRMLDQKIGNRISDRSFAGRVEPRE
jgi:hypothetical protein